MGKPFKSIEEQIEILKERGMVIDKYSFVKLQHYGFPEKWREILY